MNVSKYKYNNLKGFAKKSIDDYNKFIKENSKTKRKKKVKKDTKPKISTFKKRYLKYLDSKEWATIKIEMKLYKGNKCEICNSSKSLHVHHKNYKNLFKEEYSDLMLVCELCHKKIHNK